MVEIRDEEIMACFSIRAELPTYVISNCLRMDHPHLRVLTTRQVLAALRKLEQRGLVAVHCHRGNSITWTPTKTRETAR